MDCICLLGLRGSDFSRNLFCSRDWNAVENLLKLVIYIKTLVNYISQPQNLDIYGHFVLHCIFSIGIDVRITRHTLSIPDQWVDIHARNRLCSIWHQPVFIRWQIWQWAVMKSTVWLIPSVGGRWLIPATLRRSLFTRNRTLTSGTG